jgi:hypothetical protein
MMEVNPGPRSASQTRDMVRDIEFCREVLNRSAAETGVVRLPYSILPHVSRRAVMSNMVKASADDQTRGERQRLVTQAFSKHFNDPDTKIYPISNTSVHFTHGVCDPNHALETKRVIYAIASAMLNLLDNEPPFILGARTRSTRHEVLHFRATLGEYGLVPALAFEANDGEDYYNRLIERNLHKRLITYPDQDGHYLCTPPGTTITFYDMMESGKGTFYSYMMAQAQDWPIQKDKIFFDDDGQIAGIGNEVRDAGNGPATPGMAAAIYSAIAFDRDFRMELGQRIEKTYGLPIFSDPAVAYWAIWGNVRQTMDRQSAVEGSDRFLHAPLGTNGHTQQDFLMKDLVPMLTDYYKGTDMMPYVEAVGHVAQTLLSDAQFYADQLKTPRTVIRFCDPKLGYDPVLLFNSASKTMAQHHAEGHLPQMKHLERRIAVGVAQNYLSP